MFRITNTPIEGVKVVTTSCFNDDRGFFTERYKRSVFEKSGITDNFCQDNFSSSCKDTIRGLHFQERPNKQAKLVSCLEGLVWDVAVDIRRESKTYGQYFGLVLDQKTMLYIPEDLAHGFCVLTGPATLYYKCTAEYNKESETGINYKSSFFNIPWPIEDRYEIISEKDKALEEWYP